MDFIKMEGLGNDYAYVDVTDCPMELNAQQIRRLCDRHFGIGADGIVCIDRRCGNKMTIYNSDGSRAQLCGNALRCVAKYLFDGNYCGSSVSITTDSGVRQAWLSIEGGVATGATVNMQKPCFDCKLIPALSEQTEMLDAPLQVEDKTFYVCAVSVGNPHLIIFVRELPTDKQFLHYSPLLCTHSIFPQGINVEWAVVNGGSISVRVFERGAGETLACGSGATACFAAANKTGRVGNAVTVRLKGGQLNLEKTDCGDVFMSGPAREVFRGTIRL